VHIGPRADHWHREISRLDFCGIARDPKLLEFIRKEVRWSHAVPLELAGEGRFVIPRNEFVPAYVKTYEEGRLREKV
jgi:hypothetical protein